MANNSASLYTSFSSELFEASSQPTASNRHNSSEYGFSKMLESFTIGTFLSLAQALENRTGATHAHCSQDFWGNINSSPGCRFKLAAWGYTPSRLPWRQTPLPPLAEAHPSIPEAGECSIFDPDITREKRSCAVRAIEIESKNLSRACFVLDSRTRKTRCASNEAERWTVGGRPSAQHPLKISTQRSPSRFLSELLIGSSVRTEHQERA